MKRLLTSVGLILSGIGFTMLQMTAEAQLTIQSNPGFFTPIPLKQPYGKSSPQGLPDEVIVFDKKVPSQDIHEDMLSTPLNQLTFQGNQHYSDKDILNALEPLSTLEELSSKGLLNESKFEEELTQINNDNPFKFRATVHQPDAEEGLQVNLKVYEQQPWQITTAFDNQGRPGVGMYRQSVQISKNQLFGINDSLQLTYSRGTGLHRIQARYTIPFNKKGGLFKANYIYDRLNYDRSLTPNGKKILGRDNVVFLSAEQPLDSKGVYTPYFSTLIRRLSVAGKTLGIVNGDSWTVGMRYNNTDRLGKTKASVATTWSHAFWGANAQFWKAQAAINRTLELPRDHQIRIRGRVLVSPDAMPPPLQLPVGGVYSVRGYSEGLLNGDRGYFVSTEHTWPVPFLEKISPILKQRVRGVTFFDMGESWVDQSSSRYNGNGFATQAKRTLLMAVGVGVRARLSRFVQCFCDLGVGIGNRNAIELNGDPTVRAHFGIRNDWFASDYKTRESTKPVVVSQVSR